MEAGMGEMVDAYQIGSMTNFITRFGEEAFISAVFNGAWSEISYAYIYPCDEMKETEQFQNIQKAFINAYV